MITEDFKNMLKSIGIDSAKVELIEKYLGNKKAKVSADSIEYADGTVYYSEDYVTEMMRRSKVEGILEEQKKPVEHVAVIEPYAHPMSNEEIRNKIIDSISLTTGADKTSIADNSKFIEEFDLDSLDLVAVVMDIEEVFNIVIPDSSVESITTVGDLVKTTTEIVKKQL